MLSALMACQTHPTIILQLDDMQDDLVRFSFKLFALLGQAGMAGLQMPAKEVMEAQYGAYLKESRPRSHVDIAPSISLSRSQVCCPTKSVAVNRCDCVAL
jgi:hypothetical protein